MKRFKNITMLLFGLDEVSRGTFVEWVEGIRQSVFTLDSPLEIHSKVLEPGIYVAIGWQGWVNCDDGWPFLGEIYFMRPDDPPDGSSFDLMFTNTMSDLIKGCPGNWEGVVVSESMADCHCGSRKE